MTSHLGRRWALGLTGGALVAVGLVLLPWAAFPSLALWSVGPVAVHDAVWAPVAVIVGHMARKTAWSSSSRSPSTSIRPSA